MTTNLKAGFAVDGSPIQPQSPAAAKGIIQGVTVCIMVIESGLWPVGCEVVLEFDDKSESPLFKNIRTGATRYLELRKLAVPSLPVGGPKFAVGQLVEVVSGGWGLPPSLVGRTCTIASVSADSDNVHYKVKGFDSDYPEREYPGTPWEQSFKLALNVGAINTPPAAPTLESVGYTELQTFALNTFQTMYDAAAAHRQGQDSRLHHTYGICDNIDRFADSAGADSNTMAEVKENLIRRTESYSGNYSYPVKGADGRSASDSFSATSNKWSGDYGLNRFIQLGQMIELIKTVWTDDLAKRQTPAKRHGLNVGDLVCYTRQNESSMWVLRRDDESTSPSFHRLGHVDDYNDLDLNYVVKANVEQTAARPVAEFLSAIAEKVTLKTSIEEQIAALHKQLASAVSDIALLDYSLADQHKVKRI